MATYGNDPPGSGLTDAESHDMFVVIPASDSSPEEVLSDTRRRQDISMQEKILRRAKKSRTDLGETSRNQHQKTQGQHQIFGKYNFVIKSDSKIDLIKLTEIMRKLMPLECFIENHSLSGNQTVAMFKVGCSDLTRISQILENLLSNSTQEKVSQQYGRQVEISAYDPNARTRNDVENLARHVVARNIPYQYSEEYLRNEVSRFDAHMAENIERCRRILVGLDGRPSTSVRVICTTPEVARSLIKNGLRIEGLKFDCEWPREKVDIQRCYKCQGFQHRSFQCPNEQKCGRCAKDHRTADCTVLREHFCCALCGGQHAAWYVGCPVYREKVAELHPRPGSENPQLLQERPPVIARNPGPPAWTAPNPAVMSVTGDRVSNVARPQTTAASLPQTEGIHAKLDEMCASIKEVKVSVARIEAENKVVMDKIKSSLEEEWIRMIKGLEALVTNLTKNLVNELEVGLTSMRVSQGEFMESFQKLVESVPRSGEARQRHSGGKTKTLDSSFQPQSTTKRQSTITNSFGRVNDPASSSREISDSAPPAAPNYQ